MVPRTSSIVGRKVGIATAICIIYIAVHKRYLGPRSAMGFLWHWVCSLEPTLTFFMLTRELSFSGLLGSKVLTSTGLHWRYRKLHNERMKNLSNPHNYHNESTHTQNSDIIGFELK